jgi:hypothetical protein
VKNVAQHRMPIMRSVKKQGAFNTSYNILLNALLNLLCVSYILSDEASPNEVQQNNKDTIRNVEI